MGEGGLASIIHAQVLPCFSFEKTRLSTHISKPVVTYYLLVWHFLIPLLLFAGGHHNLKRENIFLSRSSTLLLTSIGAHGNWKDI